MTSHREGSGMPFRRGMVTAAALVILLMATPADARDWSLPAIDGDGNGVDALAVVRADTNGDLLWFFADRPGFVRFGNRNFGDEPVAGDYDGDRRTDPAVVRPGVPSTWIIALSSGGYDSFEFGTANDTPMPADYDGDRRTDAAVVRTTSNGAAFDYTWFTRFSSGGYTTYDTSGPNT